MKTKDGSEIIVEPVLDESSPKVYIDVGPYEGGFAYMTAVEARKLRTLLTRAIRKVETTAFEEWKNKAINTSGATTGRFHNE